MSTVTLAESSVDVSLSGGNIAFVVVVALIGVVALVMAGMFRQEVLAAD